MRLLSACLCVLLLAACGEPATSEPAPGAGRTAEPLPSAEALEAAISPEGLVRTLYEMDSIPVEPAMIRRYFTEEFVVGLTPPSGEIGPVDFDYRYSAQDTEILHLIIEEVAAGPNGSRIEARFDNFGQPKVVAYDLCRRPAGGWRITNVSSDGDGWSLREILDLPAETAGTC